MSGFTVKRVWKGVCFPVHHLVLFSLCVVISSCIIEYTPKLSDPETIQGGSQTKSTVASSTPSMLSRIFCRAWPAIMPPMPHPAIKSSSEEPISRLAFVMGEGDDLNFKLLFAVHNGVRKTAQWQPSDIALRRHARNRRGKTRMALNQLQGALNLSEKFSAES